MRCSGGAGHCPSRTLRLGEGSVAPRCAWREIHLGMAFAPVVRGLGGGVSPVLPVFPAGVLGGQAL